MGISRYSSKQAKHSKSSDADDESSKTWLANLQTRNMPFEKREWGTIREVCC